MTVGRRKPNRPREFELTIGRLGGVLGIYEVRNGELWAVRIDPCGWVSRRIRVREVLKRKGRGGK